MEAFFLILWLLRLPVLSRAGWSSWSIVTEVTATIVTNEIVSTIPSTVVWTTCPFELQTVVLAANPNGYLRIHGTKICAPTSEASLTSLSAVHSIDKTPKEYTWSWWCMADACMTVTSTESNPTLAYNWGMHGSDNTTTVDPKYLYAYTFYDVQTTFSETPCSTGTSNTWSILSTSTTTPILTKTTIWSSKQTRDPVTATTTFVPGWHVTDYYGNSPLPADSLSTFWFFAVTTPYSTYYEQQCTASKLDGAVTTLHHEIFTSVGPFDIFSDFTSCTWLTHSLVCPNQMTPWCTETSVPPIGGAYCQIYQAPWICTWVSTTTFTS